MYINRKDGTKVEAELMPDVELDDFLKPTYRVKDANGNITFWQASLFEEQYGEAMICPDCLNGKCDGKEKPSCYLVCPESKVHSKNMYCHKKYYGCPACIPYIPEEYDVDNEPTFPICGTCNYIKDKNLEQSNLMLSDEEICKAINRPRWNIPAKDFDRLKEGAKAELDHLEGLGLYVKVKKDGAYPLIACNKKLLTKYSKKEQKEFHEFSLKFLKIAYPEVK